MRSSLKEVPQFKVCLNGINYRKSPPDRRESIFVELTHRHFESCGDFECADGKPGLSDVLQRQPWRTIFYLRRATTEMRGVR